MRLHRGGQTRAWIGERFGGDAELGDRIWRRCLHLAGGLVLLVYVLPADLFEIVPMDGALVVALAIVLFLELLRHVGGLELPTIRPREERKMASFAYFAVGLSVAVLLFPRFIAIPVVLGAVFIDPLLGELRVRHWSVRNHRLLGWAAYLAIAAPCLYLFGGIGLALSLGAGAFAGLLAIALEGPETLVRVDDDLTMTIVPGIVLSLVYWGWTGTFHVPAF